ncbi:DUF7260 family protein [Halopenitus persicus]|uniref:DUF7260 family protein n=1 Tax=Halopenitus persicus TaxID=1048396 RepID=UPI000BBAA91C|nr:hypothetical protein [Halopenitus persicus]
MATGSATRPSDDRIGDRLAALRRAVRTERRRVADERQAFNAFRKRLADVESRTAALAPAATPLVGERARSVSTPGLCAVRDAYEETVMSVPHYVEDYDDTYPESLAAEFGRELSATLTTGTAFDPAIKRELQRAVRDRCEGCAAVLDTLDTEAASLADLRESLPELARDLGCLENDLEHLENDLEHLENDLEHLENDDLEAMGFGALEARHARAGALRDRCETLARERQATIRRQRRDLRVPGETPDVPRYLYDDHEATYPVLATIADLADRTASIRSRIETAIARC